MPPERRSWLLVSGRHDRGTADGCAVSRRFQPESCGCRVATRAMMISSYGVFLLDSVSTCLRASLAPAVGPACNLV